MNSLRATERSAVTRRRLGAAVLVTSVAITVAALWVDRFSPFERWAGAVLHPRPAVPTPVPLYTSTTAIYVVQPKPGGTDSSVSKVPLPLILTGTRIGRNAQEGYADIGVNALSPQTYKAGALLANGARLEEIYTDYVVLERNGRRARLYPIGRAAPSDAPPSFAPLLTVGGTRLAVVTVVKSEDHLTDIMRVSPVYDGDTLQALEVYGTGRSDAFARLGLEPGDRVTAIQGLPIKNSAEAMAQLRQVSQGASLNVTIERGGKAQTLSLNGWAVKAGGTRG